MDAVTVSPTFQVVIPRAVRERGNIRAGDRLQVLSFDDRNGAEVAPRLRRAVRTEGKTRASCAIGRFVIECLKIYEGNLCCECMV